MPSWPNSFTSTAVPRPSGVSRKCLTSVVLPAPRKPVTTVTGIFAPRSRFCRRPKRPADGEGKSSCTTYPSLPRLHPNSGLPEFGTSNRPKSDISDFGWRVGEGEAAVARLKNPSPGYTARR